MGKFHISVIQLLRENGRIDKSIIINDNNEYKDEDMCIFGYLSTKIVITIANMDLEIGHLCITK